MLSHRYGLTLFTHSERTANTEPLEFLYLRLSSLCSHSKGRSFRSTASDGYQISDVQLPFLDLCLKPVSDRLLTSIHYKDTDTHSYLYYTSSHPARCKNSIPYSQFLRLRRICSEDNDFENKSIEMASFFRNRDYPSNVIQRAQERVSAIPRHALISERSDVPDAQPTIPLVLTYHPTNALIKNIMTRNFHLLRDDPA